LEFREVLPVSGIFRISQRKVGLPAVLGDTVLRAQEGKWYELTEKEKAKSALSTGKWIS
jgi:hypothetical protein